MTEPTDFALVESHTFHRPLDIRAESFLGTNASGEPHIHAWADQKRSAAMNQEHVAYDQVVHYHLQGERCSAQCRVYIGLGVCDASQRT